MLVATWVQLIATFACYVPSLPFRRCHEALPVCVVTLCRIILGPEFCWDKVVNSIDFPGLPVDRRMKRPSQQDSSKKTACLWDAPDFFIEVATTTFLMRPQMRQFCFWVGWGGVGIPIESLLRSARPRGVPRCSTRPHDVPRGLVMFH